MEKFIKVITSNKFYLPFIYIVIGVVLYLVVSNIVDKIMERHKSGRGRDKRKDTIINLSKNIFKYLILILVVLEILKLYGVDTTSIIASLGIFAAVIGLAFQDILKDLLAGVSIIFDNKFAVGDMVSINNFTGTVIQFGLRTTKIKSFSGEVKSISNSSFTEVVNYNLAGCDLYIKLNVAYNTNIEKLEMVLESIRDKVLEIEDVTDYKLLGVDELGGSSIVYLVDVSCSANGRFSAKRKFLRLVKDTFDKEKIEIPYTTVDVNVRKWFDGKDRIF